VGLAVAALALAGACARPDGGGGATFGDPGDGGAVHRAVVLGPAASALVGELGAANRVVGVSDWCTHPAFADRPRVGGLIDPDLERIAALEPDLVLVQGRQPRLAEWCRLSGVRFRAAPVDTLEAWRAMVSEFGRLFAAEEAADELLRSWDAALAAVDPRDPRPRILLVAGRDPEALRDLLAAGPRGYLGELLERAGGENVLADADRAWVPLREEVLVRRDPEVVVELWDRPPPRPPLEVWRETLPNLSAVRDGRVVVLVGPEYLQPGPELPRLLGELAAVVAGKR